MFRLPYKLAYKPLKDMRIVSNEASRNEQSFGYITNPPNKLVRLVGDAKLFKLICRYS